MLPPSSSLTSRPWRSLIGCALATWAVSAALQDRALAVTRTSDLHRDEEIVFFPSLAHRVHGGSGWECEIRGCVYEPEKRRLIVGLLHETLEFKNVELTDAEAAVFAERTRLLMVDNQRGRTIVVRPRQIAIGWTILRRHPAYGCRPWNDRHPDSPDPGRSAGR